MSYEDVKQGKQWTPYGSYFDLEPPEPEYCHAICWNSNPQQHNLIKNITWL